MLRTQLILSFPLLSIMFNTITISVAHVQSPPHPTQRVRARIKTKYCSSRMSLAQDMSSVHADFRGEV